MEPSITARSLIVSRETRARRGHPETRRQVDSRQSGCPNLAPEDGRTRIECRFEEQTLWLSQAQLAELFQVSVSTVNEHLSGIYAERELES